MTVREWWQLARPPTLPASVVPIAVGTSAAALSGPVSLPLALLMLVVGLLLQIATNMTNEYADYTRGIDDAESFGIAGVLVSGRFAPNTIRNWAFATYGMALGLGLILVVARGWPMLLLGLTAIAVGFLYNAGPRPLSATAGGELLVFIMMGPIEVLASQLAAGGRLTAPAAVASISVGFLVAAILMANNLRDRTKDAQRGRRTLAIRLGEGTSWRLMAAMVGAGIWWPAIGAALSWLPPTVVMTVIITPWAWHQVRQLRSASSLRQGVLVTGRIHLLAGLTLGLGLLMGRLV